jgi:hypothetical protein
MMKKYRWIMIAFLVLALAIPATPVSAAQTVSLQLTSPKPNPAMVGGEITFDLAVNAEQNNLPPLPNPRGVAGIELYLSYNPAVVTPPTTPGSTAAEVLPDFFGAANVSVNDLLPAGSCRNATGTLLTGLPCIHLVVVGPPQASQSGIAARFHFRVLVSPPPTSATFTIVSATVVNDSGGVLPAPLLNGPDLNSPENGNPCPAPAPGTLCIPIQARVVQGKVLLQGATAGHAGTNLTATSSAGWRYDGVTTDVNGNFTFNNLPHGTYDIRATHPGYLDSIKIGVAVPDNATTINIGTTTLVGGDVNSTGNINILDIGSIISQFNLGGRSHPIDINDDTVVNISDLAIAAGNWNFVTLAGVTPPATPWIENPWALQPQR